MEGNQRWWRGFQLSRLGFLFLWIGSNTVFFHVPSPLGPSAVSALGSRGRCPWAQKNTQVPQRTTYSKVERAIFLEKGGAYFFACTHVSQPRHRSRKVVASLRHNSVFVLSSNSVFFCVCVFVCAGVFVCRFVCVCANCVCMCVNVFASV